MANSGSSPRMRGTHRPFIACVPAIRFIPAHAGNSTTRGSASGLKPVHPRACGELLHREYVRYDHVGSSPRMRGTRSHIQALPKIPTVHPRACGELELVDKGHLETWRFIPAHAGNSLEIPAGGDGLYGSSPRMRGTQSRNDGFKKGRPVHPRACGELLIMTPSRTNLHDGSSPRMRGTLRIRPEDGGIVRFIPAHAGNSFRCCQATTLTTVHPRACGELQSFGPPYYNDTGSSPRMRGTLCPELAKGLLERFIPAHAGNSFLHPIVQ